MRIVASVQAKRGSSRGLVHYVAHSKLDVEREPEDGREIFNAFADDLSVTSANNSIKVGIAKGRPSNDELHHLVLSFRSEDYRSLGANEKQRSRALKEVTRTAMQRLEIALAADRLSWAAAVHLNTDNPHVHIAMQKQYFTKDIERKAMTKIPREVLPHFEHQSGDKVLVPGFLIEAATTKLEQIIAREKTQLNDRSQEESRQKSTSESASRKEDKPLTRGNDNTAKKREILGRGILAEYELHRIELRLTELTDYGDKKRFLVSDPASGRRRRLSLRDLDERGSISDADPHGSPERQIKTILLKMLAKEEAAKAQLQSDTTHTIREADRVREQYRKNDWKLPVPSLTKDELDQLQDNSLDAAEVRRFFFLERIRSQLERSGEIEPRGGHDLSLITAQRTISDMRSKLFEKNCSEFNDRRYYRLVDLGGKRVSIAQLDREVITPGNPVLSFVGKVKEAALRLSGKGQISRIEDETGRLRADIANKLDEHLADIEKNRKAEQNKYRILDKILVANTEESIVESTYSPDQLAEIETLSFRLKVKREYDKNWNMQRTLIEAAGNDCPAYQKLLKANPAAAFSDHKNKIIAGRALAREIVARVEFEKAKEDFKTFKKSKRFQKFGIANKETGKIDFVSLHDVELPKRGSLLDRAVDELFEGREHRSLRRAVTSMVKDREQRLTDEVSGAKSILASAARDASEFKQFSFLHFKAETSYQPIFTSSEIRSLELRAASTRDLKGAAKLQRILDSIADQPAHSLGEILRDFERPEPQLVNVKEIDPQLQKEVDLKPSYSLIDPIHERMPKELRDSKFPGHSR
ncbi:MAG: relaxase MobL [Pyrinomonadaceae bacterium]